MRRTAPLTSPRATRAPGFLTHLLLASFLALLLPASAVAAACAESASPRLSAAQFTSAVRSQQPQDNLPFLPPGSREVFIHATTRGAGKITYRWFRDGRRVIDVGVNVGNGEWHTWSRLRLPPPLPGELRVQILGADGCLLREMTLAATAFADHPEIRRALQQLASGDAAAAKLTLNILLEETPARSPVGRSAQRLLDVEVAVAQAAQRAGGDELFLVEPALAAAEKKLGRNKAWGAADRQVRARIAAIRAVAAARRVLLAREGNLMVLATQHLLETQKIFSGDYPLLREDAEDIVAPALLHAGDTYAMLDWEPTLRGYRLILQDKRSGDAFEVMPER
jgi:hypothetical protein